MYRLYLFPGLLIALLVLASCATNPVTGKSDFVLMSEDKEKSLGRELHEKILRQKGAYDDPELQAYVQRIGSSLASVSHRQDLNYQFTVVDGPQVNAFALPGGYIYIERGLLAYLNSEAELAAVLGHELGHVTARHSVRQHSASTTTQVLTSVLASTAGVYGAQDVANIASTALVRGYGREHELEADRLGAQYLARAGYDPASMLKVIRVLKDQELYDVRRAREEGREPQAYHGLFSTHPDNDQRLKEVIAAADQHRQSGTTRPDGRDVYLQHIDGLVFGESEHEGVQRGNEFFHRELDLALTFPEGWSVENLPDRLVATPPGNDGLIQFSIKEADELTPPKAFLVETFGLQRLSNEQSIKHRGMDGYTAVAPRETPLGVRPVRYVVFYRDDQALVIAGLTKDKRNPYKYDEEVLATARSFHRLGDAEQKLADPRRIRVVRATSGTSYKGLARKSVIQQNAEGQLRLLNAQYPSGEPASGASIKIVK